MYCTHWSLSSMLDTCERDSSTLFKGHTIGYKCFSNCQHKYLNVCSFQCYGYRNCLPGAPEFCHVCPDHCFLLLLFFFLPLSFFPLLLLPPPPLLLPLLLILLLLSSILIFLFCIAWYLYNFSFCLCLQFRNNWWLSSMWFQNLNSDDACSFCRNSGLTAYTSKRNALKGTAMIHNKVNL